MTSKTTVEQIKHSAARAFYATAWADAVEEHGVTLRGEIMDWIPRETDPAALRAADTLLSDLIAKFDFVEQGLSDTQKIAAIYMKAVNVSTEEANHYADRELTPDNFGHYLAMQAMGHGVGLECFGSAVHDAIPVPYVEFGSHSLERDYQQPS